MCSDIFRKYGSAAKHGISVIKNCSLTGSNGSLRLLEGNADSIFPNLLNNGWLLRLAVTGFYLTLDRVIQMIPGNQINIPHQTGGGHKIILPAKNHLIVFQGFCADVKRFRCRNAQTSSLTNCVMDVSFMGSQNFPFFVDKISGYGGPSSRAEPAGIFRPADQQL